MLAKESTVVNYTGFVLGKFENGENIPDTTKKCTDINLRKAIAHAIDNNYIGQQVYFGLRRAAEGIIPPAYAVVPEQTEYYEYNPEKACKILDESNFKDIDGDGFREDKNGGQLTIVWAVQESPDAETVAEFKIKQWEEIGLRVVLQDGKPIPFDSFYPSLIGETSADMFDAAWDYGKNPNPAGFWGAYAQTNFTRYSNDTIKTLCGEISSEKAWNMDFLKEKFSAFEKEFFTTLPAAPTFWRVELVAVNKKVKNFDAEGYNLHKIGVEYTE
jgi:peptide/nickel transport system substrate-binding protein